MSVIPSSIKLLFQNSPGERSNGQRRYTAAWRVKVSDPRDNQVVVLAAFDKYANTTWSGIGNGSDTTVMCTSLSAARMDGSRLWWIVTGTWETPQLSGVSGGAASGIPRVDDEGVFTDDPFDWRDQWSFTITHRAVPIARATLIEPAMPKVGRPADSEGPVINSAGEVFDPPIEEEVSTSVFRLTRCFPVVPDFVWDFQDVVNSDEVTIIKPGFRKTFEPAQLRMNVTDASLQWHRTQFGLEIPYVPVTVELRVGSWHKPVLNLGRMRRAILGDPNGDGKDGKITIEDIRSNPAAPNMVPITEDGTSGGNPISVPVPLDIDGQPYRSRDNRDPLILEYKTLVEKEFMPLGIWS